MVVVNQILLRLRPCDYRGIVCMESIRKKILQKHFPTLDTSDREFIFFFRCVLLPHFSVFFLSLLCVVLSLAVFSIKVLLCCEKHYTINSKARQVFKEVDYRCLTNVVPFDLGLKWAFRDFWVLLENIKLKYWKLFKKFFEIRRLFRGGGFWIETLSTKPCKCLDKGRGKHLIFLGHPAKISNKKIYSKSYFQ